jgi:hypothetical protein
MVSGRTLERGCFVVIDVDGIRVGGHLKFLVPPVHMR